MIHRLSEEQMDESKQSAEYRNPHLPVLLTECMLRAGCKDVFPGDAIVRGQDQQVRIESVKLGEVSDCCIRFGVVVVRNGHENALREPPLYSSIFNPPSKRSEVTCLRFVGRDPAISCLRQY